MDTKVNLAFIGGSGLYEMPGLSDVAELVIETPFGAPSDVIVSGVLLGQRVAFLARHGRGHRISPTEINYRANIFALKTMGVNRIISVSACGSLRAQFAPGHIVIPDQLYDNTRDRARTFFGDGLVAHVGVADPFCRELSRALADAIRKTGATVHEGGTFVTIEGPRFSTRAESHLFRGWGMDIIGMTTSPEAFLAREAEICYAVMGHVTDYDVWHESEVPVTVEMIIRTLEENAENAQAALGNLAANLPRDADLGCDCGSALADALITRADAVPDMLKARLRALVCKYLD
ncbi:MAG: S-methyl-5'-thioadenosine phosphorylase [Anaerolineales bacterium]|jgi:5'-methylthioadenosine phosphorylase|nr:S-methyl-5'-thioadenosine phosphorylase [Anaerolineales bacterium]MDP7345529.1 S-methyl-5'-thioadenosine phosphorylase [Anaerolineales bacterium]MDP7643279.1 S-methyl-5'-thioadenosine phosphorylase [Anaerolineales bacterium]HJN42337.1 S-methyl-5'-thioadenosine phosphorylase [Anaerolineales bacterium]|tara:strand:+ start:2709 stop:3581 length:873 start_codon:yes stop_codon:yes gene_type:complete